MVNSDSVGLSQGGYTLPTPQLIKDAMMLIVGYKADVNVLREMLPEGLEPHPNGLVQMNMYQVPDPNQTSGFGSFSLAYLTIEVANHDSLAVNGTMQIPGRYFIKYWNSSDLVRSYVRENCGIPATSGELSQQKLDNELLSILSVNGKPVIKAKAEVGDEHIGTIGGHLNYYAHRKFTAPEGGKLALSELLEFPLPFTAELYEASVRDIEFNFPENDSASLLKPILPLETPSVMYGKVTFTYSMGRRIRDYLNTNNS